MKPTSRWFASFLAVTLAFFVQTTVSQAGGKLKPPPKIPYTGIVSVDKTAMTITVAPKNSTATGTKTYKFSDKTKITANGHPGTVADLTPGQQIHIGAGADPLIADEISVTAPPPDPVVPGKH